MCTSFVTTPPRLLLTGLLASLAKPRVSAADPYIGYKKKDNTLDHSQQPEMHEEEEEDYHWAKGTK